MLLEACDTGSPDILKRPNSLSVILTISEVRKIYDEKILFGPQASSSSFHRTAVFRLVIEDSACLFFNR